MSDLSDICDNSGYCDLELGHAGDHYSITDDARWPQRHPRHGDMSACFASGVDPEGNPWCVRGLGHDGPCRKTATTEARGAVTLAAFLLARIAEDEEVARDARVHEAVGVCWCKYVPEGVLTVPPARVLAECETKRRIVGERNDDDPPWIVLRHLAAVYADHEDYRDEWRA